MTDDEINQALLKGVPYGFDAAGRQVVPEEGYEIIPPDEPILPNDKPFDAYAGWIKGDGYHARVGLYTDSCGRWTTWERPIAKTAKI